MSFGNLDESKVNLLVEVSFGYFVGLLGFKVSKWVKLVVKATH